MSKPIEVGCKCEIINDVSNEMLWTIGLIVTIEKSIKNDRDGYEWETDYVFDDGGLLLCKSIELMRIDDDEQASWDEIAKLGFIPNRDKEVV